MADAPVEVLGGIASEHGVYFDRGTSGGVMLHYYDATADRWEVAPPLELPWQEHTRAGATHGDDFYLLAGEDLEDRAMAGEEVVWRKRLWRYQPASDGWQELAAPRLGFGDTIPLDTGLVLLNVATAARYAYFDFATETWREGELPDPELFSAADQVRSVTVDGRSLVLLENWPHEWGLVGTVTLTTWDPASNQLVMQTSRELTTELLQHAGGRVQVADPGIAYLGPDQGSDSPEAALVDLRDGSWSMLEVPVSDRPLVQRYESRAFWAKAYFGDRLAEYVISNDYLLNPVSGRWLAVPIPEVPPPDVDRESGDATVHLTGSVKCEPNEEELPRRCWRLTVDPLEAIAAELPPEWIAENNRR
ncbi:MAG: hypothetical protein QM804_04635 [Propionicimonas sp.]